MYHTKTCLYCNSSFEALRSDAKYCTAVCRTKSSQNRALFSKQEKEYTTQKLILESEIVDYEQKINDQESNIEQTNLRIEELRVAKTTIEALLSCNDKELIPNYQKYYLPKVKYTGDDPYYLKNLHDFYLEKGYRSEIENRLSTFRMTLNKLLKKAQEETNELKEVKSQSSTVDLEQRLKDLKEALIALKRPEEDKETKTPSTHKRYIHRKVKKRRKTGPSDTSKGENKGELSSEDVIQMSFDTYELSGELGRFLGELDYNKVAFALTGDSGAGKSYFSYELAGLFLDEGKSVKYYSLEEGIGKLTREKLLFYDIGSELRITDLADLSKIRKDASRYDVLIIDSYSKIATDPKDFEVLRQSFPKTLFIIIFQKTTGKTIRGGSSIKYNSSATIDVCIEDGERVAKMEKGRYGTQGWIYSIDQGRIIKEN